MFPRSFWNRARAQEGNSNVEDVRNENSDRNPFDGDDRRFDRHTQPGRLRPRQRARETAIVTAEERAAACAAPEPHAARVIAADPERTAHPDIAAEAVLRASRKLGVASFRKRNGAVKIALDNAGARAAGSVCASDGFFPFRDNVDLLGRAGVKAIIQPGGSVNDPDTVAAADEYGITMAITHTRAFKH